MIFGLVNRNSGPGFHRIIVPLMLMKDTDVYVTNAVKEEDFEDKRPHTIFYNRLIGDAVLDLQAKYHFRIVVDVDDYWILDPFHIMYNESIKQRIPDHQIKHIRLADAVTTTHERLAEKIYPYNKNVVVLHNAIPKNAPQWFPINRTKSEYRRIFWQGSVTHEKDIAILRNPIKRLDRNKFLMVMCGYTKQEEWERMASGYTNGLKMRGVILPGKPVTEYYCNYQYADVCVCPLVDSTFNSYKSNLKILEAAHSGLPVIASHVNPYLDMPGVMYVKKQDHWGRWLNESNGYFQAAADELKAHVDLNFDFETINETRKLILQP